MDPILTRREPGIACDTIDPMFRFGIGAKLTAVTLSLLVLLTAGALFTVRHFFGQQLRQQAVKELVNR